MKQYSSHAVVVLIVLLFSACNKNDGMLSLDSSTGVRGQVLYGPLQPVEQPGVVNYVPVQATVEIKTEKGVFIAQFVTNTDGRFEFGLSPGEYVFTVVSPIGSGLHAKSEKVTVLNSLVASVVLLIDTGIR